MNIHIAKLKGDSSFSVKGKKNPIVYCTNATMYFILELAKEYKTVKGVYKALHNEYNGNRLFVHTNKYYDAEAEQTLKTLIDKGYGDSEIKIII